MNPPGLPVGGQNGQVRLQILVISPYLVDAAVNRLVAYLFRVGSPETSLLLGPLDILAPAAFPVETPLCSAGKHLSEFLVAQFHEAFAPHPRGNPAKQRIHEGPQAGLDLIVGKIDQ